MRNCMMALVAVAVAGCGTELLTTTAIRGELEAQQLTALQRQVKHAGDSAARINIQRAIDIHYAEKGFYPATLEELVPGYLPSLPKQPDGTPYYYDPARGKLVDEPVAPPRAGVAPVMTDTEKMDRIRVAIDQYGRATGYYPVSLAVLVPNYLPEVPKTASGQDFIYYPQNGALYHPSQFQQHAAPQYSQPRQMYTPPRPAASGRGVGASGGGPMAEMMTGIAVQNELNRMSNSGTSAGGAYARSKVRQNAQQRNKQQEQMLDELGY